MGIGEVQRQSIVSFISQIGITFFGFLSTIYFAHAVGAGVLGAYFLFMAYYGIISMVTDGGFGGAAIKRISEGREPNEYLSAFVAIRSFFVIMVVVALTAFRGYFVDLDNSGAFSWLLAVLIISILSGTVSNGIAGSGKIGILASCNFISEVSRIFIQVIAVFFGFGVAGLIGGFVAGMLAGAIVGLRFLDLRFVRFSWRHIKSLSFFSFWLFLTSSGVMLYSYFDTIMIGYYLGNEDVGVYRVVLQFTSVAAFITIALHSTLWPKVSRWGKAGERGLIEKSLPRACSYSLILAVPLLAGGVLLGDRLLYFLYGQEFTSSYATLIILLVVQLVNVFQYFFTMYLGALDHQKEAFKVTIVAVTANVVLNILLIPVIGIAGAAIATLATMLLNAVLARRVLSEIINIRIGYTNFLSILKASFVMSLFVGGYRLFIPLSSVWLTVVPVILGGILYAILILRFDKETYEELKGIFIR